MPRSHCTAAAGFGLSTAAAATVGTASATTAKPVVAKTMAAVRDPKLNIA
jgi:hypothetical protein